MGSGGQVVEGRYFEPCQEGIPENDGNLGKCVQCGRPSDSYFRPAPMEDRPKPYQRANVGGGRA